MDIVFIQPRRLTNTNKLSVTIKQAPLELRQGEITYHFTVTRLMMMRSTGRSWEAPSRMASRTWLEALCRRLRSFAVKAESVMKATMVSGSLLSGSVESTSSCHSSSLSASYRQHWSSLIGRPHRKTTQEDHTGRPHRRHTWRLIQFTHIQILETVWVYKIFIKIFFTFMEKLQGRLPAKYMIYL